MRFISLLMITLMCGFFSKNSKAQNFGGGLVAGASTSQVAGDLLGGFNKIGFLFGAYTTLKLKEKVRIQYGIHYIEKGSRNPNIHKNNIAEISLSYVEMPISINLQQYQNLGVEFGLLSAFLIESVMNDYNSEINIDPKFAKNDFGIFAGINYHLTDNVILNSRICNSILPIRPHISGATKGWNKGQYNSILSFAIHYQLK